MYQTHILGNGLKIVHQYMPNRAAYCGLIIGVGTRDENEDEAGVAHFIEHLIFKGTKKRKAYHILSRIEDVGGELNAYTTKEDTCIYSSFLAKDYPRALELFSDIIFNSIFPEKEISKEKEVVVDEINSYKDSPDELIFDDFEELVYCDYPIGKNILGTEENVRNLSRDKILNFANRNYQPNRMVISSIGDIKFEKLIKLIEKYFGGYTNNKVELVRSKPSIYKPQYKEVKKDTFQNHCIIGNVAYDYTDDRRIGLSLLNDILGGDGSNSRLNLNIREKHGLVYNVESVYTPYSDTGIFTLYFACDKENLNKCIKLCEREMQNLCNKKLGKMQILKAKKQMIGQITLSSENYENMMLTIGKSFLIYGKVDELEDLYKIVNDIDTDTLQDIARDVLDLSKQTILIYK